MKDRVLGLIAGLIVFVLVVGCAYKGSVAVSAFKSVSDTGQGNSIEQTIDGGGIDADVKGLPVE